MIVLIVVLVALLACAALALFEVRRARRRLVDRGRPATLEGGGSHLSARKD